MARVSPMLVVDDIARSMDYYEKTLGFKKGMAMPGEGGQLMHGEVTIADDIMLMFSPGLTVSHEGDPVGATMDQKLAKGGAKGAGVLLYFDLSGQDIDKYYEDVKKAGARIIEEITD